MSNFIEKCLRGEALLEDIDDYIDEWHDSASEEPLYSYLGMSAEENVHWLKNSDSLPIIISSHKYGISYNEAVARAATMAARSTTINRAGAIQDWLDMRSRGS